MSNNGRKLQTGTYLDGYEDLESKSVHIKLTMPDMYEHAAIIIKLNQRSGNLEISCTDGEIVVTPRSSNLITVNARDVKA